MPNYTINPNQIVGRIIPNVYISKITLQNEGFQQGGFQENPHIDPPRGSGIKEGEKLPGSEDITVSLQLTVKDVISHNSSKWFAPDSFPPTSPGGRPKTLKDYIKVVVIQTTTAQALHEWTSRREHLMAGGPGTENYQNIADAHVGTSKYEFFLSELDGPNVLERYYQEYDQEGNSVRNVSKTIKSGPKPGVGNCWVDLDSGNTKAIGARPEHLAYFVWTEFDIAALAAEYSVTVGNVTTHPLPWAGSVPVMSAKTNSDVVFKDAKLVKDAYAFFKAQINPSKVREQPRQLSPEEVLQGGIQGVGFTGGLANEDLIPTSELWVGPVHHESDLNIFQHQPSRQPQLYTGWMGGTSFINLRNTPLLIQKTVPNTKIQDFRVAKRIDKLNLSLSNLENVVLKLVDNNNRRNVIKGTKFSYFTDIYLSRDKDNNCRFFFGIDLRKMVRENSIYSKLFSKNSGWLQEAMMDVRILSMRIFRKRVQGSSEMGETPFYFSDGHEFDPTHKLKKFNNGVLRKIRTFEPALQAQGVISSQPKTVSYDPSDELIIEAIEMLPQNNGYALETVLEAGDGVSAITKFGSFYAPSSSPQSPSASGIFYYTGTDAKMSEMSDGYYQYRIELEIQDDSARFLEDKQTELANLIKSFEQYFQAASKPGLNGLLDFSYDDPHTDEESNKGPLGADSQKSNFDPVANQFTQEFETEVNRASLHPATFATNYVNILMIFIDLSPAEQRGIIDALDLYISPRDGNLQGCLLFLGLLRRLMSVMDQAIGVQMRGPLAANKSDTQAAADATGQTATIFKSNIEKQGAPNLKSFKMKYTFPSYYDGNLPSKTGFDFLGTGLPRTNPIMAKVPAGIGLRQVGSDIFKNTIVTKEIKKIFKDPQQNVALTSLIPKIPNGRDIGTSLQNTDFTYLTPATVVTPNKDFNMVEVDGDVQDINSMHFINSWIEPGLRGSPPGSGEADSLQEKVADFLSYNYSLSVIPDTEAETPVQSIGPPKRLRGFTHAEYMISSDAQAGANQNAFDILWNLVSDGLVSEGNRGGVTLPEGSSQRSLQFYNPDNSTNGFLQSGANIAPDDITDLPNSVKALIKYNDQVIGGNTGNIPGVSVSVFKPEIDTFLGKQPFMNPEVRSKARVLFETVGQIDVFAGYDNVEYGQEQAELEKSIAAEIGGSGGPVGTPITEPSIARTKWRKLTRQLYNEANNYWMLCRIRRWENSLLKIKKDPGSELPIYEEYFLLEGGNAPLPTNMRQWDVPITSDTFIGTDVRTAETEAVTVVQEVELITNPRTDYITSNWLAEDILSNLESVPPEDLMGDIQPREPSGDGGRPPQFEEAISQGMGAEIQQANVQRRGDVQGEVQRRNAQQQGTYQQRRQQRGMSELNRIESRENNGGGRNY